jgi:hypothetical protein
MPLPAPGKVDFSTGLWDCCHEDFGGAKACLYTTCCFGCSAGDMAVKMEKGEVLKPNAKDPCYCCGEADKRGFPWVSLYTPCCGTYYGACCLANFITFGPQSTIAVTFTRLAFRSVKNHFGLRAADEYHYCLLANCCCLNLCIQVRSQQRRARLRSYRTHPADPR